jgi:signal transduction histidine kinase
VELEGGPGPGLSFLIRNPPLSYGAAGVTSEVSGMGLVGLTERVTLGGGVLAYGTEPTGDFVVHGTLPWSDGNAT